MKEPLRLGLRQSTTFVSGRERVLAQYGYDSTWLTTRKARIMHAIASGSRVCQRFQACEVPSKACNDYISADSKHTEVFIASRFGAQIVSLNARKYGVHILYGVLAEVVLRAATRQNMSVTVEPSG